MSLVFQIGPQWPAGSLACIAERADLTRRPDLSPAVVLAPDVPGEQHRFVEYAGAVARVLLCSGAADSNELSFLEAAVDEHVDVWTPALHITSRFELVSAVTMSDDAVTEITVTFTESATTATSALLAWLATGRFTRPAILDDDQLLEPTGAVLRLPGAITMAFTTSRRVQFIRCYYDRIGLLGQMLMRPPTGRSG